MFLHRAVGRDGKPLIEGIGTLLEPEFLPGEGDPAMTRSIRGILLDTGQGLLTRLPIISALFNPVNRSKVLLTSKKYNQQACPVRQDNLMVRKTIDHVFEQGSVLRLALLKILLAQLQVSEQNSGRSTTPVTIIARYRK
jgi:hypothetical protein